MTSEPADLPPLESEPAPPQFLRPWFWFLIAAFVGYPLSIGPIAWFLKQFNPNPLAMRWIDIAYFPLEFLYENVPFVHAFYDWYLALFGLR